MLGWLPSKQMSVRAKGYLTLIAFRHLSIGIFCLTLPYIFESPSFDVIKKWAPLWVWGVTMLGIGVVAISAVVLGRAQYARFTIVSSLALTSFWAGAFITDAVLFTNPNHPGITSPVWAAAWVALSGKDLILTAMPLRSPFEDLLD